MGIVDNVRKWLILLVNPVNVRKPSTIRTSYDGRYVK